MQPAHAGRSVSAVADSLGVNRNMLTRWKSQLEKEGALSFPGQGKQNEVEEENRRLRRAEVAFGRPGGARFTAGAAARSSRHLSSACGSWFGIR